MPSFIIRSLLPAALMAPFMATAQSADTSAFSTAPHKLAPVEVRSLRAGNDAPFAKTEISGASIQNSNLGQDLPFLLQYTPSTVVTSDAGAGVGYTGLRIRGTDATRINVTLNGVPVNDAEDQSMYFVDLPDLAASTTSIQIQRGIGTSTNGAGAFGATVSISNIDQLALPGADASISAGSYGTQKYMIHAGTGIMKSGFSLDARLSQILSNGYVERSGSELKAAQLTAGWLLSNKTSLHFMALLGYEKTHQAWDGVPEDSLATHRRFNELGQKSDGSYYDNQTDNYWQNYYQLFADHHFTPKLTAHVGLFLTRGYGYYEEYKNGQSYADYGLPNRISPSGDTTTSTDLIRQLWLDNYNYGTVFSVMHTDGQKQFTLGGGLSRYDGNHYGYVKWAQEGGIPNDYRWYNLDSRKTDFNLYAKAQYPLAKNLLVYGDAQYRRVAHNMNGFRDNPTDTTRVSYNFFNPKGGITWLLENNNHRHQKLYASIACASHEPNRGDFENAETGTLPKPERMTDIEAGYEVNTNHWTAGVNLYYMDYKDQLILTGQINDVGDYYRINVPKSHRAGIELMGGWKPNRWFQLQGNTTFSQNKIANFTEYLTDYDNGGQQMIPHGTTDIAFSPNVVGAAAATFTPFAKSNYGKGFELTLASKYVGTQYLDNTSNSTRRITDYTLLDVRLRYAIAVKPFRELAFSLALNNILNRHYESNGATYPDYESGHTVNYNYYFPQAGTNILAGISVKW